MIEERETLTGSLYKDQNLSGSIQSNPREQDPTVPSHVKMITEENIRSWNKIDQEFGIDYTKLANLPTINGKVINGNLSGPELGLQPEGNYATIEYVNEVVSKSVSDSLGGEY